MRLPVGQYWTMFICFTVVLGFASADKLSAPRIRKVVYFENNSTLAVALDKEPPMNDFLDEYKVILHHEKHVVICSTNCSSVPPIDGCECRYSRDLFFFLTVTNITVRLIRSKAKRVMASSKTTTAFYLYEIVCPEPVVNMALNYVNSSMIQVSFQPSENTKRKIGLMNLYEKPLSYKVTLASYEGRHKHISLQAQFLKTIYWLSERPEQNVAVVFQDLDPNTKYTVSVSGVGGGGEGDANSLNFTTHKSVPLKPPVLPPFSFTGLRSLGLSSRDKTCVFITWQPLPKEYTGGSRLHYNVNITKFGTKVSMATNVTTNFITESLSLHPHHITVWAANEMGPSKNYSQLMIPDFTDLRDVPFYVAFNNDSAANIFVHLPDSYTFQSLAIHWCLSDKSLICRTQTICKGTLHTQHFNLTDTGQIHNFSILLGPACKKFISETKRKVTYLHFESMGDETVETRIAEANVTETEYRLVYPDNEETGEACTDTDSITENVGPKAFFVSIKDKDDKWMGMRPARCYYHNDAKTVDVKMNQTYDDVKNTILNIGQRCDPDPPAIQAKQFLVKQFQIYSTISNNCHEQDKLLAIIDNVMNIPVRYKLPPELLYVCVVAVGQLNSFTISTTIVYPRAPLSGLSETAVITLVSATMLIILAVVLGFFYKKCRDSQQYFERFWKSGSFASLKHRGHYFGTGKSVNDPTIPECIPSGGESWVNTGPVCASYKVQRVDAALTITLLDSLNSNHAVDDSVCFHHDLVHKPLVPMDELIPRHYCRMNVCGSDSSSCTRGDSNSSTGFHETADSSDSDDTHKKDANNVLSVSLSGHERLEITDAVGCSDSEEDKSVSSVSLSRLHDSEIQGAQSIQNNISNSSCSYSLVKAGLDFVSPSNSGHKSCNN